MKITETVKDLQQKYDLLHEHYGIVLKAAEQLEQDETRLAWVLDTAEKFRNSTFDEVYEIPLPESDGTLVGDMLPLFVLLLNVDEMVRLYNSRGFFDITSYMDQIPRSITAVNQRLGKPGINKMYYEWLCSFLKGLTYNCGVFRVSVGTFNKEAVVLQNKDTDEIKVLMCGKYHKSGNVLGSAGADSEEGAFCGSFRETDTEFCGCTAQNGLAVNEIKCFPKAQWKKLMQEGDGVIYLHIPKGSDLSPDKVMSSAAEAFALTEKYYKEQNIKAVCCSSWLLNPKLADILGEESKIALFGAAFERFPVETDGMSVFGFVFPQKHDGYDSLPENTRLERGLKKIYQNGDFLHNVGGVFKFKY